MEILCPKCGEPWDHDSLHDEAEEQGISYSRMAKNFRQKGCAAFEGCSCGENVADESISAIYDLLGDDMDAAAALFEDFDLA